MSPLGGDSEEGKGMKQRRVLSALDLPTRLPIMTTIVAWLLLDRLSAPGWVWGIAGTLLVIYWIACVVTLWTEKSVRLQDLPRELWR